MKIKVSCSSILLFVALFLMATPSIGFGQSDYTITTVQTADLGNFLVDGQGKTLYYFTKDSDGGSNCKGQCAVLWPPFYAEKIVVPVGLDATEFGTIMREDGMKQTTFRSWPLYYFSKDMAVGDVNGQKFNGVWFVINIK